MNEDVKQLGRFLMKVYLPKKEKSITANEIAKEINTRLGEFNRRYDTKFKNITGVTIRDAINWIRSEGQYNREIISSPKGYYLSEDLDDILRQIESMEGRVRAINNAISGMRKKSLNYKRLPKTAVVNYNDKKPFEGDLFHNL